jgi:hypothetical protein
MKTLRQRLKTNLALAGIILAAYALFKLAQLLITFIQQNL